MIPKRCKTCVKDGIIGLILLKMNKNGIKNEITCLKLTEIVNNPNLFFQTLFIRWRHISVLNSLTRCYNFLHGNNQKKKSNLPSPHPSAFPQKHEPPLYLVPPPRVLFAFQHSCSPQGIIQAPTTVHSHG